MYQWWKQKVAESLGLKDVCNGFVSVGKCCFLVCRVALVLTLVHLQVSFPLDSEEHGNHYSPFCDVVWVFQTIKVHNVCGRLVDAWQSHSAHLIMYRIQEDFNISPLAAVSLASYLYHKRHHYHFQTNQGLVCMPCMYKRQIRWVIDYCCMRPYNLNSTVIPIFDV